MTVVRDTVFVRRLHALMQEYQLSVKELADRIYMNRNTVKGYLSGRHEPIVETLARICEVFNVSADYLIGLTDERKLSKEWEE